MNCVTLPCEVKKIMFMKSPQKIKHVLCTIMTLTIPSYHRWNECATPLVKGHMHLRTDAIVEKLSVGSSRNTLFTLS